MTEEKKHAIMNCETFDDLLDQEYGPQGTPERASFETEAEAFCLAETLREQRRLAGLTQQELADKIGTKKSYISKLENGHADVQLSTLFRIFAGLGKRISLTVLQVNEYYIPIKARLMMSRAEIPRALKEYAYAVATTRVCIE